MQDYRSKIKSREEAKKEIDRLKAKGKRVVFTNGCFDILHPGHTRYLYTARALGDYLVVAVNSDQSVRAIKGEGRPILSQDARTELLAALSCVDSVIVFDEEDPLKVIQYLMPHILVKGGDWKEEEIIGADVVKKGGGEVARIPYIGGFSTTDIIKRLGISMHLYSKIYEFAASAGALEGYVYQKEKVDMEALTNWVENLVTAYNHLPPEALDEFQSSLDQTIGRAIRSLSSALGKEHEILLKLKSIVVGSLPDSADDFQKKKWFTK